MCNIYLKYITYILYYIVDGKLYNQNTLREILLVVLTKRSQLYIFSKRYLTFCKTYQYLKVDGTKYAGNFLL